MIGPRYRVTPTSKWSLRGIEFAYAPMGVAYSQRQDVQMQEVAVRLDG